MSTGTSTTRIEPVEQAALLPGYYLEPGTGAWLTLPWPTDLADLPQSLGPGIIHWLESRLQHHLDRGPWRFTLSQRKFIHLWYAVRFDHKQKRWRWVYRSGVKRGAKGTGKDPLAAALSIAELCGPVIPTGDEGNLVGRAHNLALVQIAANSEAQAGDVLRVANAMITPDLADEFGFDPGITRTQIHSGGKIELLTFSERSSEGDPATAIFLNEPHHMTVSSGGQRLAGVARRNAAKSPGGLARLLELTNAHMPGEGSVAEDAFTAWQAQTSGRTVRRDILYDSREAPPHLRLHVEEELEQGIAAAYHDSPWTDLERIRDEAQDVRVPLSDSVRYYFNALPTNEMSWVNPRMFDALARRDEVVKDGEPIAMFLDCSKSTDATTLVGCRLSDGFVMSLGGWRRPHGDRGKGWLVPRESVDAAVRLNRDRYQVRWFGVDPSPAKDDSDEALFWGPLIDEWHELFRDDEQLTWATPGTGGHAVMFDMRLSQKGANDRMQKFTAQAEATAHAIDEERSLRWDGDTMMRVHVHNARRRPNKWGVGIGKRTRDSSDLVDYAVSMVGARLGRRLVTIAGPKKARGKKSGKGYYANGNRKR